MNIKEKKSAMAKGAIIFLKEKGIILGNFGKGILNVRLDHAISNFNLVDVSMDDLSLGLGVRDDRNSKRRRDLVLIMRGKGNTVILYNIDDSYEAK